jgi:hypothetical protein
MSNLSPKTIQKHVDNMWVLGGEFITELNNTPSLDALPSQSLSRRAARYSARLRPVDSDGRERQARSQRSFTGKNVTRTCDRRSASLAAAYVLFLR